MQVRRGLVDAWQSVEGQSDLARPLKSDGHVSCFREDPAHRRNKRLGENRALGIADGATPAEHQPTVGRKPEIECKPPGFRTAAAIRQNMRLQIVREWLGGQL